MSDEMKDEILKAVESILQTRWHEPNPAELITAAVLSVFATGQPAMTAIKYIGKRPKYSDGMYETGNWESGQVKMVPVAVSARMTLHPDVYQESEAQEEAEIVKEKPKEVEVDPQEDGINAVNNMQNIGDIKKFVADNFSGQKIKLPKAADIAAYRTEAIRMIDTFHLPE